MVTVTDDLLNTKLLSPVSRQLRQALIWIVPAAVVKSLRTLTRQPVQRRNLLLVKRKEKNLLKIQPLPKVLRVQAIRPNQLDQSNYVTYVSDKRKEIYYWSK